MNPNDLVILNQAKALEDMRQRLRSHMMKLTDRQLQINRMEEMIARRDNHIEHLYNRQMVNDRSENYNSELCQELENAKATIKALTKTIKGLVAPEIITLKDLMAILRV